MWYAKKTKKSGVPNYPEVRILLEGKCPFPISFLRNVHTPSLSIYDLVLVTSLVE